MWIQCLQIFVEHWQTSSQFDSWIFWEITLNNLNVDKLLQNLIVEYFLINDNYNSEYIAVSNVANMDDSY